MSLSPLNDLCAEPATNLIHRQGQLTFSRRQVFLIDGTALIVVKVVKKRGLLDEGRKIFRPNRQRSDADSTLSRLSQERVQR